MLKAYAGVGVGFVLMKVFEEVRDGRETRVRVDRVEVVHRGEFWMDFNHFGFARRVRVFGFVREVSAVEEHFVAR